MNCCKAVLFLLLGLYSLQAVPLPNKQKPATCQACHPLVDGKINVHLVPHSHDDVGWLKTVDQYYTGDKPYIQRASVKSIITTAVEALKKKPDRRYIQVETAFLAKWWDEQDQATKDSVVDLVKNGQLEIVNGAWSMNDEAAANYHSIIDQFTWGLKTLNDTLGECGRPKIGWQIDPFGHSREHASLLTQFGFEGLIIGRIDYRDKRKRIAEKNLDFIWKSSANLDNSKIFTSMFPDLYMPVRGFCLDSLCGERISNGNVEYKVSQFTKALDEYAEYYRTPNILMPMGGDFHFQEAEVNFASIDNLVKGFKDHPKYNVIYSTPSCYIKAVNGAVNKNKLKLTEKLDDFFPYASGKNKFWTGYFSSRPTSKRFERVANNVLQSTKQLATFSTVGGRETDESIHKLREALGIMQHHDAITGTEKQEVAYDYAKLLNIGITEAVKPLGLVFADLLKKVEASFVDLELDTCLLANISICEASTKDKFLVALQNPLSREVNHFVHLPVEGQNFRITGPDGEEIFDVFDTIHSFDYVEDPIKPATKELVFEAKNLPPLGIKLYYVEKLDGTSANYKPFEAVNESKPYGNTENGFTIDSSTGKLATATIKGETVDVSQEFQYYEVGSDLITSGAYMFRPNGMVPKAVADTIDWKEARGNLVDQVLQVYNEKTRQIIRVYKDESEEYIEFDWLVGNLSDKIGTEFITKFIVKDLNQNGTFYTDSNGREQIQRKLNTRSDFKYDPTEEPISSNYYPINSKIVIKDETKNLEVAVLNDRAQGSSSLDEGTIELMVHRRLFHDDDLGVNEPLNEREYGFGLYARGQHYLTFGPIKSGTKSAAAVERDLVQRKRLQPLVLVADATKDLASLEIVQNLVNFKYEPLNGSLPENVLLLTLEPWNDDTHLLRLEHTLEKDEDDDLSKPVTVDLEKIFNKFHIKNIGETTLAGNQWLMDYGNEDKLIWEANPQEEVGRKKEQGDCPFMITLKPMEIRTFVVKLYKRN